MMVRARKSVVVAPSPHLDSATSEDATTMTSSFTTTTSNITTKRRTGAQWFIGLVLVIVVVLFWQATPGPSTLEIVSIATTGVESFKTSNDRTTTTTTNVTASITASSSTTTIPINHDEGSGSSLNKVKKDTSPPTSPQHAATGSVDRIPIDIDLFGRYSHRDDASIFSGGLMGILSALTPKNRELRDFYRSTWIKEEDTLGFRHLFLIDEATNESHAEQAIYGDLLYLNSTHRGVAVKFGEKLALWFKYVHTTFPNASWVGKMDDDVALCPHHRVWKYIQDNQSPTMYLGSFHDNNKPGMLPLGMDHRMDEMFVIVGGELVKRISEREYCIRLPRRSCQEKNGLYDTNFGGTSLGLWLRHYQDVNILPMGRKFHHLALFPNVPQRLCKWRMLLHKADICRMKAVWNMTNDDGDLDPMICGGMQEFDKSLMLRGTRQGMNLNLTNQ